MKDNITADGNLPNHRLTGLRPIKSARNIKGKRDGITTLPHNNIPSNTPAATSLRQRMIVTAAAAQPSVSTASHILGLKTLPVIFIKHTPPQI